MDDLFLVDELSILDQLLTYLVAFSPESERQSITANQTQDIVISGAWIDLLAINFTAALGRSYFINFHGLFSRNTPNGSSNLRLRVALDGVPVGNESGVQVLRQGQTIPVSTIIQPGRGLFTVSVQGQKQGNSRDALLNANLNEMQLIEV